MQKFHDNNFATRYLDKIMSPGETHEPFASLDSTGNFVYPWHQYYGDTECIWIANEFHVIEWSNFNDIKYLFINFSLINKIFLIMLVNYIFTLG